MFDKNDKKNHDIVRYFSKLTILIVDPLGMNRTSIKKTMINLGIDMNKIITDENLIDAKKTIEEKLPDIVFVKDKIHKENGLQLLKHHMGVIPNRLEGSFFIITEDTSPAYSCLVLDSEVDGIIISPFTINNLEKTIIKGLRKKFSPGPYLQNVERAKAELFNGNDDSALALLEESLDLNKTPVLAKSYLGELYLKKGDNQKSRETLTEGLEQNPKHYRSLKKLAALCKSESKHKEQYQMSSKILEDYPLNPSLIPEMIKLSIRNEKYEDIWNYTNLFTQLEEPDTNKRNFISAGLAICARFLMVSNKISEGKKAIERSAFFSEGKIEILESLVETILQIGEKEESIALLEKYATDDTDEKKYEILLFKIFCHGNLTPKILTEGRRLINSGKKYAEFYHLMFETMVKGNSKKESIEDLLFEAKKECPDNEEEFMKMLSEL